MDNSIERHDTRPRTTAQRGAPWLLVLALTAGLGWLAFDKWGAQDRGDIVATSMMVFERQNALTVFSSRFDVVAESVNTPSLGPLELEPLASRQAMIVPATVEYRLDMSDLSRGDFTFDETANTLDVVLPPITLSDPNIDGSAARVFTDGVYVSRDASAELSRSNSAIAQRRAQDFAQSPEVMQMARSAAIAAVRQNLEIPLQVAGFEDIEVRVRFPDSASR